jgi:hypothetical protein
MFVAPQPYFVSFWVDGAEPAQGSTLTAQARSSCHNANHQTIRNARRIDVFAIAQACFQIGLRPPLGAKIRSMAAAQRRFWSCAKNRNV